MYQKNCNIRNMIKMPKGKFNFSPRSNTQEISSRKNKNYSFGKTRINHKEKEDDYFRKNSAININSIKNDTNTKLSLNSEAANIHIINNTKAKSNNKNFIELKYTQIINNKNKEIRELQKKIEKEKNKLALIQNQQKNSSQITSSSNLSKTRSSTNFTERNLFQVNSLCNSQTKIKASYLLNNKRIQQNNIDKIKLRAKSDDYKKAKNAQKKFLNYNTQRTKTNNFVVNHKRCNSSKQKNNKNNFKNNSTNKNNISSKINNNIKQQKTLSIQETKELFENIYNKYKNLLDLLKKITDESDKI